MSPIISGTHVLTRLCAAGLADRATVNRWLEEASGGLYDLEDRAVSQVLSRWRKRDLVEIHGGPVPSTRIVIPTGAYDTLRLDPSAAMFHGSRLVTGLNDALQSVTEVG